MKPISLLLTNQHGDELGRMRMASLHVAEPGEQATHYGRLELAQRLEQLSERIHLALAQEGFAADGDRLDVQICVSRALLAEPPAGEELLIPLPVHPVAAPPVSTPVSSSKPSRTASAASGADPKPEAWDDLFDLSLETDEPQTTGAAGGDGSETGEIEMRPAQPPDDLGLDSADEEE